jgi:hypothetical protein
MKIEHDDKEYTSFLDSNIIIDKIILTLHSDELDTGKQTTGDKLNAGKQKTVENKNNETKRVDQ